jgi:hypothetical protein
MKQNNLKVQLRVAIYLQHQRKYQILLGLTIGPNLNTKWNHKTFGLGPLVEMIFVNNTIQWMETLLKSKGKLCKWIKNKETGRNREIMMGDLWLVNFQLFPQLTSSILQNSIHPHKVQQVKAVQDRVKIPTYIKCNNI